MAIITGNIFLVSVLYMPVVFAQLISSVYFLLCFLETVLVSFMVLISICRRFGSARNWTWVQAGKYSPYDIGFLCEKSSSQPVEVSTEGDEKYIISLYPLHFDLCKEGLPVFFIHPSHSHPAGFREASVPIEYIRDYWLCNSDYPLP